MTDQEAVKILTVMFFFFGIAATASIIIEFISWMIWKRKKSKYTLQFKTENINYTETVIDADAQKMLLLLKRYRYQTPLEHQPLMIASEVDDLFDEIERIELNNFDAK